MFNKKLGLIALLVSFAAGDLFAGDFNTPSSLDVMLCFRKSGGANDLVVDAGLISTFTNATPYQRIAITGYTGTQLSSVATNNAVWSAFAYFLNTTVAPAAYVNTLFLTSPRATLLDMTASWPQAPLNSQKQVVGWMKLASPGAKWALTGGYNANSTATAVIEPDSNANYTSGTSYSDLIGVDFNFNGLSSALPENTTAGTFTTSGKPNRSDFWMIPPSDSGGSPRYLGIFELNTNGLMTYIAYPYPPAIQTVAASAITATSATLNCTVNPNGENASYYFQYGLSSQYSSATVTNVIGTTNGSFNVTITGLTAGTTYHFGAAGYNQYSITNAGDLSFTTASGSVTVPSNLRITRTNTISYISFTTGNTGTYTLRGTNSTGLSVARTNWPAISSGAGTGSTITLQDNSSNTEKFYVITAQ